LGNKQKKVLVGWHFHCYFLFSLGRLSGVPSFFLRNLVSVAGFEVFLAACSAVTVKVKPVK
jgi:hypothetical protein